MSSDTTPGMIATFMSAAVGADVEALCSKCGDVWHVVVAKLPTGQIAKVQCKQCGGYHRYKSPHGAPTVKKLPATNRPPKEPKAPVERFDKPDTLRLLLKTRPYELRAGETDEVLAAASGDLCATLESSCGDPACQLAQLTASMV